MKAFSENRELRFLQIQDTENEDRRILIELRLTDRNLLYGDWFVKSENKNLALIDSTQTNPVDEGATRSMVYKDRLLLGFVNDREELWAK